MAESKLRELSTDFAVKIIKLCETIKGHYSLVNQLERSATSIGANIREANNSHGKLDFIAKLLIVLKECYEKGINESMIHVDFMIGTEDLSITAITRDGKRVAIFENGNWAF